jgi:solute carrier family 25 carnitine/acylcarnitine transporter 20/29
MLTPPGAKLDVPSAGLLMAGGLAGVVGWLSTYPIDVVKTRLQSETSGPIKGLLRSVREIYRREGGRVLFAGLGATAVRAFPTNAATFYVVTAVKNLLECKKEGGGGNGS